MCAEVSDGNGQSVLLTYSNSVPRFRDAADALCDSATEVGFDRAISFREEDLRQSIFWEENSGILTQARGAGYWLWKPYVIMETLKTIRPQGILFYCDAGRNAASTSDVFPAGFPTILSQLTRVAPKGFIPGFRFKDWMTQARYTKIDCFALMNAMQEEMFSAPQIGASWSIWTPTQEAFSYLIEWLKYATDPRIITDDTGFTEHKPHYDFDEHRHDQAIASILMHRHHLNYINLTNQAVVPAVAHARKEAPQPAAFPKKIGNIEFALRNYVIPALRRDHENQNDMDLLTKHGEVLANLDPSCSIPYAKRYALVNEADAREKNMNGFSNFEQLSLPKEIRDIFLKKKNLKEIGWTEFVQLPIFAPFDANTFIPYAGLQREDKIKRIQSAILQYFQSEMLEKYRSKEDVQKDHIFEAAIRAVENYYASVSAKSMDIEHFVIKRAMPILSDELKRQLSNLSTHQIKLLRSDAIRSTRREILLTLREGPYLDKNGKRFRKLRAALTQYYESLHFQSLNELLELPARVGEKRLNKRIQKWKNGGNVREFEGKMPSEKIAAHN